MVVATKDRTLKVRLTAEDDYRIRAAAEATNVSVTDFVMRPALMHADEVLLLVTEALESALATETAV